jgi:hypothetical protein
MYYVKNKNLKNKKYYFNIFIKKIFLKTIYAKLTKAFLYFRGEMRGRLF